MIKNFRTEQSEARTREQRIARSAPATAADRPENSNYLRANNNQVIHGRAIIYGRSGADDLCKRR